MHHDDDDLSAILDAGLLGEPSKKKGRPLRPSERIGLLVSAAGRVRAEPAPIDAEVASLLRLIGLDPDEETSLAHTAARTIADSAEGMGGNDLPAILQAYARGVGRIVAAEAEAISNLVRAAPPDERSAVLGRALDSLGPAAENGFKLLHDRLLHDALSSTLADDGAETLDREHLAVGMVDFVGSTHYLVHAEPAAVEELADLLFEGAQWLTTHRRTRVVKYVGDGVFLAGPDVAELADVALELVATLEAGSPLRARGGVTIGHVVQRAGDIFGLPVNRAHILTKAARPGAVIADEPAAKRLPAQLRGRPRTVELPHPALGSARVVTVRRR